MEPPQSEMLPHTSAHDRRELSLLSFGVTKPIHFSLHEMGRLNIEGGVGSWLGCRLVVRERHMTAGQVLVLHGRQDPGTREG